MNLRDRYTSDEIEQINKQFYEQNEKDFHEFKNSVRKGQCWLCKDGLSTFDETKPCPHWLLMPAGFRKKHVKHVLNGFSYDVIEGFLRWYVNAGDAPFRSINDIEGEHDPSFIRAFTIKDDKLEWSFSFAKGCLQGQDGHGPHYHFQMRVDDRPFFNYSNYHIKLSSNDLQMLKVQTGEHPDIVFDDRYAMGMEGIMTKVDPKFLMQSLKTTDDEANAMFHMQTMVVAEPGTEISGDDIADLIEESRRTGVPMAQLVKRISNVRASVFIEPGDAVPKAAQRKKVRTKKQSDDQ